MEVVHLYIVCHLEMMQYGVFFLLQPKPRVCHVLFSACPGICSSPTWLEFPTTSPTCLHLQRMPVMVLVDARPAILGSPGSRCTEAQSVVSACAVVSCAYPWTVFLGNSVQERRTPCRACSSQSFMCVPLRLHWHLVSLRCSDLATLQVA